jgi:hypothetical protein
LLVDRDPGVIGVQTGHSIAMRIASGPQPGLSAREPLLALRGMTGPMLPEAVGLHAKRLSCEWSASTTRWLEGVSKHGERAYVTKLLKEQASAAGGRAATQDPTLSATRTRKRGQSAPQ